MSSAEHGERAPLELLKDSRCCSTALRFPALIPASSESQFSCEMLYCFICGFQLSPSCLHPETLLFPACLFFSSSSSSFLRSFRSKGCPLSPAPSAHVLCPSFSHRRHLMSLMSCPGCSPAPPPPPHCPAAPVGATRALLPVHLETRPDPTPKSSAHCVPRRKGFLGLKFSRTVPGAVTDSRRPLRRSCHQSDSTPCLRNI